jgi:hypothetical protein
VVDSLSRGIVSFSQDASIIMGKRKLEYTEKCNYNGGVSKNKEHCYG